MKTELETVNADKVEMRMTITMPLGDWKILRSQLGAKWPSERLGWDIGDLIRQAEQHYYPEPKPE